jgi:5-methylcytosine-specific restriction endonuclease McrBC GTP-binding regulatory subunit McrB
MLSFLWTIRNTDVAFDIDDGHRVELEGHGQRRTYIHLGFKDTESAKNAVNELDQRFEYAGLRVDFASSQKGRKLFVGDIPPSIRPEVLQTIRDVPGFERFFDRE